MAMYKGRFAPSPTGPMHLGSLVAALASWLDARAYGLAYGASAQQWLVRIEDTDRHRCQPGAAQEILRQLAALGLQADAPVQWQSQRQAGYAAALERLQQRGMAYACQCSRKDIEAAWLAHTGHKDRFTTLVYPGTCRHLGLPPEKARAWRFRTDLALDASHPAQGSALTHWHDRRLGPQSQDVARDVGDFVLLRADGMWSYQLACVVDDAEQGITHVVRGQDLQDNTARQIQLQAALGVPAVQYLHIPLALDEKGEKLSKSNGALAVQVSEPLQALGQAARILALDPPSEGDTVGQALARWTAQWRQHYPAEPLA